MDVTAMRQENDLILIIHIPIKSKYNKVQLYGVSQFPIFINGTRYKTTLNTRFLIINSLNAAAKIGKHQCTKTSKICKITKPLRFTPIDNDCITSQLISKNNSCEKYIDSEQQSFFKLIENSIYYAINGEKNMVLLCEENKTLTRSTITLKERGRFILRKKCVMKNDKVFLLPESHAPNEINHSNVLETFNVKPLQFDQITLLSNTSKRKKQITVTPIKLKTSGIINALLDDFLHYLIIAIAGITILWIYYKKQRCGNTGNNSISYQRGNVINDIYDRKTMTRTTTL
jgi:hypothetical protein